MSRMEDIGIIQKMTEASFEKKEQHQYYYRRSKKFLQLKNHGDLQTAQTKITNRNSVPNDKLLRWHGTVDETLNELDLCNDWNEDQEGIKKSKKTVSFWGNMDKTSMSAADGKFLYS